jgi:pteridine reductase
MANETPVALITGAAKRIGAEIAQHLHRNNFNVAIHHRNSHEQATALATELNVARANSAVVLQADLAEFDRIPELIANTIGSFGRLDALINNASSFFPTPIGSVTPVQWQDLFASNAWAPFFLSQAAAPHLKASNGCIINMIDIYAERPAANHTVYCMAKAALQSMTLSLARELAPQVRVNGIAPGAILWPETGKSEDEKNRMLEKIPLNKVGQPSDIASAVLWLAHEARYTTGQIIRIDGGRHLSI